MLPLFSAVQSLVGWAIVLLATCLAADLSRRIKFARPHEAVRWLACAAFAVGCGIWASFVLSASASHHGDQLQYGLVAMLGGFAVCVIVAAAAIKLICSRNTSLARTAAVVVVWGGGMATVHAIWGWGLAPQASWISTIGPLVTGACIASVGVVISAKLLSAAGNNTRLATIVLSGAAVSLSATVSISQHVFLSRVVSSRVADHELLQLPLAQLLPLALVGATLLLGFMLLSSRLEASLRVALRRAKGELQQQAFTDPLTELPSRIAFEGALAEAVRGAERTHQRVTLMFINVDAFKAVNDALGYRNADRMLREIATRLKKFSSRDTTVSRLGGDEFLLLINGNLKDDQINRLAVRVLESIKSPCRTNNREVVLLSSIGIASYPDQGALGSLVTHAEAAMRAAKQSGGDAHCFFEARMMQNKREQLDLLRDLKTALTTGQLVLYYQPKIHGPSGEITGAEALVRWNHPQRGLVGPNVFIPLAEQFGLINSLGAWVIDEACRQIHDWRDGGLRMRVAINLSVHQLREPDLVQRIAAALAKYKVNPQLLTCEITESVAMEDANGTIKVFQALKAIGVRISIDDFGTGYSSLSYLCKLPADEFKIDRSFVQDLETSEEARAVVEAVVKLGQTLKMKVVAEGVELEVQHQLLRSLGCDELQGFLFAKPMSAQALELWAMKEEGPTALPFRDSIFKDTMPAMAA